jgi:hypothetical protein
MTSKLQAKHYQDQAEAAKRLAHYEAMAEEARTWDRAITAFSIWCIKNGESA